MKISEVTDADICTFIREDPEDSEAIETINVLKPVAAAFLGTYTGLDDEELDTHEDITYVYLAAIAQMYDNRTLTVEADKFNRLAAEILSLYSKNNVG